MSFLKGLGAPNLNGRKFQRHIEMGVHFCSRMQAALQSSALPSQVTAELVLLLLLFPGMGNKLKLNKKPIKCHPQCQPQTDKSQSFGDSQALISCRSQLSSGKMN